MGLWYLLLVFQFLSTYLILYGLPNIVSLRNSSYIYENGEVVFLNILAQRLCYTRIYKNVRNNATLCSMKPFTCEGQRLTAWVLGLYNVWYALRWVCAVLVLMVCALVANKLVYVKRETTTRALKICRRNPTHIFHFQHILWSCWEYVSWLSSHSTSRTRF